MSDYDNWKCFRVTMDDDAAMKRIVRGTSALVSKEAPDKEEQATHYHILVYTPLQVQALRQRVYVALGDVPNRGRKCAFTKRAEDLTGYKRYICKGEDGDDMPNIVVNTLGENVEELHNAYWRENARIEQGKRKERGAAKSRMQEFHDYFDKFMADLQARDWEYVPRDPLEQPCSETLTLESCALHCVRWYISNGYKIPSRFQMQSMVTATYAKHRAAGSRKEDVLLMYYGFRERGWM